MLSFPDFKEKKVVLLFPLEGHKVSFKNDNLIIKNSENKVVLQTTCYRILALWIVGDTTITTGLLSRSKKFGFPVYLMSYTHRLIGYWNAAVEGNIILRKKQYIYNKIDIAKWISQNKINNQISLLKSIRQKDENLKEKISKLFNYQDNMNSCKTIAEIMGNEGVASKVFFGEWFAKQNWKARRPRTKMDPLNVLLDMGYTYLFYFVENMLNLYGFDLYIGVLHQQFYQRKSLVCDIVEPFRCIIDKSIKRAYGLNQINLDDFKESRGKYFLDWQKTKPYAELLTKAILEYKSEIFLYCQSYYRAFIREKEIEDFPFFDIQGD